MSCGTYSKCNSFQNWDDIGYSFLIGGDGNVYEGRGFGTKGSHSYCYNQYAYGIAFIGNFCIEIPSAKAIEAYETFMQVISRDEYYRWKPTDPKKT